jgi:hypothetical protein
MKRSAFSARKRRRGMSLLVDTLSCLIAGICLQLFQRLVLRYLRVVLGKALLRVGIDKPHW